VNRTCRDDSTRDLLRSRLKLREDVRFWPERYGERIWYHIEHCEDGRFFRVGQAEYTFISLLDGETSLGEAISLTARTLGPDALTEQQATSIALWLLDSNLANPADAQARPNDREASRRFTEKLNPFWIKLPIGNPDRLLDALSPWLGWIHSGPAVVIAFCLWMAAAISLAGNWTSFSVASQSIFAPENWLYLTGAWIGLKIVHELAHALACKRHGGSVRETGLIFILLAPMAFVDVTSSIRFRSKWQRIQVSAGGMYFELTLAAIAILMWGRVESPVLKHVLHNIVVMATFSTVLFNANPLMRFDGYYILSDLLEIPNLYQRGGDFLKRLGKGLILGIPQPAVQERGLRAHFVRVYGISAFFWRMLICAGLLIAASAMFEGLGIVLALAGIVAWFGKPAWKMVKLLADLRQLDPRMFFRTATMSLLAAGLFAGVFYFTPWPGGRVAPGYVEFRDSSVVRAGSPGFVSFIHVIDGQRVHEGDPLVDLSNPELESEVVDLEIALEQSRIRQQQHVQKKDAVASQVETENRNAILKRLSEKQKQLDSLQIRAPQSGRVMARGLTWKHGTYLKEGDEVGLIGDDAHKEFRASLSQEDADALAGAGDSLAIRIHARSPVSATLRRMTPRATVEPPHEALTAAGGGRLAVRERWTSKGESEYELVEARFVAEFTLPEESVDRFPTGAVGEVTLRPRKYGSLGEGLYRSVSEWVDVQIAAAFDGNRRS
jgi:putative peptide zinc metalloprotease protein